MADELTGGTPWWDCERDDQTVSQTIAGLVAELASSDIERRRRYRLWDDLYDGYGLSDVLGADGSAGSIGDTLFNYSARALDMVHSKVTSEVPTVRASGRGADYMQHLRAQSLSHFIVGATDELELPTQLPKVVHCALRVGTGCVAVEVVDGDPVLSVFHPRELLVDPDDARQGDPRCLYRVQAVDKAALLRRYPDHAAYILSAGCSTDRDSTYVGRPGDWTIGARTGRVSNCADVIDAWILPDEGGPGRHVRCLDNGRPLVDRPWTVPRFPVAVLRAWEPTVGGGFYGHGLMARLTPGQLAVNENQTDVTNQLRFRRTIMTLPDGLEIAEGALSDQDPEGITVVRTSGNGQVQFHNPDLLGPNIMPVLEGLKQDIYTMAGTDESAAGSQTPLGRDASGVAIRTYHDFQSQGHVDIMKRIGRLVVDVVERLIDAMKATYDPADRQTDWLVRHPTLDAVRWSEVDMDRDAYVLELEEVSPVPDTQAGALQEIEEDAAAGRIPPEYMTRLREDPDRWWMERCNSREDVEFVDWMIQELMDPRRPTPELPDEVPRPMLQDRLRREILSSIRHRRPPEVTDRLRAMAAQVADADQTAQQDAQGQAMAQGGPGPAPAPTGAPPPPPVNP